MQFIQAIGKAFITLGFVRVKNHGIDLDDKDDFYAASKDFFSQKTDVKKSFIVKGAAGQDGYTSFGVEHAKQSKVADLKEFFQIGRSGSPRIEEVPDFHYTGDDMYKHFENSGARLLRAIALFLELPENYFDIWIMEGNSILRTIHYPPITEEPKSAIRAERHEDINLITLLIGASAGGLQLLNTEGEWLDIKPEEDEIVVNVGDMLQRLTNNYLKSVTHRVVNPPKEEWHRPRLSIPFFLHPRPEMDLSCLESCVTKERPLAYEAITAGDYLDERLVEIGLKKPKNANKNFADRNSLDS